MLVTLASALSANWAETLGLPKRDFDPGYRVDVSVMDGLRLMTAGVAQGEIHLVNGAPAADFGGALDMAYDVSGQRAWGPKTAAGWGGQRHLSDSGSGYWTPPYLGALVRAVATSLPVPTTVSSAIIRLHKMYDRAAVEAVAGLSAVGVKRVTVRAGAATAHATTSATATVTPALNSARYVSDAAAAIPTIVVKRKFARTGADTAHATTAATARVTLARAVGDGAAATSAATATVTPAAPPVAATYLRGVNTSGGEFGETANQLPGIYGTDYHYDTQASFTYLGSRGHKVARLPFRWERLQPTRGAALDATALQNLKDAVARIKSAGMTAILDVHNYARYIDSTANGGITHTIGDGALTAAQFADLWSRLSVAFKGNTGVYGYGLMNEPHDIPAKPAGFVVNNTAYGWDDGTTQSWNTEGTTTAKAVTGTASFDQAILKDSPRAYFTVDGMSTDDLSGKGHTLTYPNGVAGTKTIANGDVIAKFDGSSQYAEIADADDLSVTSSGILTIAMVFSPDTLEYPGAETSGDGNCVYPLIKGVNYQTNGDQEYCIRTYSKSASRPNRVSGYVFNPAGGLGAGSYFEGGTANTDAGAPPLMQVNETVLVHVKIDTVNKGADGWGTIRIYRDGVLQDHDSLGDPYNITPQNMGAPVHIGARPGHSYFSGGAGKVAFFGDLTDAQIKAHADAMFGAPAPKPTSNDGYSLIQTWDDGTTQGWIAENTATVANDTTATYEGTGSLKITRTDLTTTGTGQTFRANDNNVNGSSLVATNGGTMKTQVLVPAGAAGTWQARLQMKKADGTSVVGTTVNVTPGTWTEVSLTPAAADWTGHQSVAVQVSVNSPGVTSMSVNIDSFRQGPVPAAAPAGAFHDGSGSLALTKADLTTAGGTFTLRANDANHNTLVVANGDTISAWVYVPSDATGTWKAHLEMQNSSYQWQAAQDVPLSKGTWTRLTYTPTSALWAAHRSIGVQFSVTNPTRTSETVYIDSYQQGALAGGKTGAQVWEDAAQQALNAIRANGDTTLVLVGGVGWSGALNWANNHPTAWITDSANNHLYEAHYYFDRDNSGDYPDTYAAEVTDAQSRGFVDLVDRARQEIKHFLDWLTSQGAKGFIGEIGWPKNGDTAGWNSVGDAIYADLDAAGVGATAWAAGEWYGTTYNLSAYQQTGSALDTPEPQATVLEAHPSA